ncbi:uncharacterized protein LOC123899666 isoform X2 [Trifolium pratense]|uniref:uncharacterized protein LOC123899666 isoform X2 n=1 Tax=Trifolium pratense TaxID=57577 RepID=UPI001E69568B|nr:uncharacterized protein LOC123899666 isoform X2 [Trifolium pratense]
MSIATNVFTTVFAVKSHLLKTYLEFENKNTYHKCGASRYKEREVPKSKRKVSCKAMKKRMSDLAQSLGMPPGFGDGLK